MAKAKTRGLDQANNTHSRLNPSKRLSNLLSCRRLTQHKNYQVMSLWTGDIVLKCRARGDSVDLNQAESHIWLQLFSTRSGLSEVDKIAEYHG